VTAIATFGPCDSETFACPGKCLQSFSFSIPLPRRSEAKAALLSEIMHLTKEGVPFLLCHSCFHCAIATLLAQLKKTSCQQKFSFFPVF
jgi:hypothetical protein